MDSDDQRARELEKPLRAINEDVDQLDIHRKRYNEYLDKRQWNHAVGELAAIGNCIERIQLQIGKSFPSLAGKK